MGIDLFIDSYNKLDDFMRIKLKKDLTVSHAKLLSEMSKLDNVFARLETKLQAYRALRNAIVHKHREGETPIAIPNHDVVLDYQRIVHYALTPPLALNSIAVTKIKAVEWDTTIEELNQLMLDHGLSLIPIVREDKIEGIFSSWHLQTYLFQSSKGFQKEMTLQMMYDHLNLNHPREYINVNFRIGFCPENATIEDVVNIFLDSAQKGHYYKAVYLTGNGQSFEKLKGVITPHSLPMINPTMLDKKLHV